MPVEREYNNHVEVYDLLTTFTNLLNDYQADREIAFYAEVGMLSRRTPSVKRVYCGTLKNLTFGDIVTALATSGRTDNLASVKCRVTTFDTDDKIVVTIL